MYAGVANPPERRPKRILVVRLGAMGDIIHTLPAVSALGSTYPDAEIVWAVDPKWAVLLEKHPRVQRVVRLNRKDWPSVREAVRQLRALDIDFAVDFQGLIKSALLAAVARPEKIYGFARGEARETAATWCYSTRVAVRAAHVVEKNLELAGAAGARLCGEPEFPLPPGVPEGVLPAGCFVLANPLAGWASKQWPLEYYSELARMLPVPLVLNGPPASENELRKVAGAHIHLSGLPGLIDATRRAAAVVGVDSGPLHLAAALGKPGVAIFGPTDPARNGPYGGTFEVLRTPGAPTTYKRDTSNAVSMRAITTAEVAAKLTRVLRCPDGRAQ